MAPDGLTAGRAFRTLSAGDVYSRSGRLLGTLTAEHLHEMARLINERATRDPVILDWNHGSSPMVGLETQDKSSALGIVLSADVLDDGRGPGLYVTPAYNAAGLRALEANAGTLWSSPEFVLGDVHDRVTGDRIAGAAVLAVALTNRPAQAADRIDAVRLSETDQPKPAGAGKEASVSNAEPAALMDGEEMEGPTLEEALARIAELEAELAAAQAGASAASETVQVAASEAATLRGQVVTLSERVERLDRAAKLASVDARLMRDGIAPAQRDNARKLLLSGIGGAEDLYASLFGEGSGHRVPLGEIGHGVTPVQVSDDSPDSVRLMLRERAEANGSTFNAEKLALHHSSDPADQRLYHIGFGEPRR